MSYYNRVQSLSQRHYDLQQVAYSLFWLFNIKFADFEIKDNSKTLAIHSVMSFFILVDSESSEGRDIAASSKSFKPGSYISFNDLSF